MQDFKVSAPLAPKPEIQTVSCVFTLGHEPSLFILFSLCCFFILFFFFDSISPLSELLEINQLGMSSNFNWTIAVVAL